MLEHDLDPWPDKRCSSDLYTQQLGELFNATLNDAIDERPLQTFLATHSYLLTSLLPPGRDTWCWDRPSFGGELIPDFLLCTRNSTGFQWIMIELESPSESQLTQSGLPAKKLRDAMGQVRDWRSWLRDNIAYAQNQLGFKGLNAESRAFIIIGRRNRISSKHAQKWRELSDHSNQIMSYDRLLETIPRNRFNQHLEKNAV